MGRMGRTEFLDDWNRKASVLLDDALAILCDQTKSPFPDGVLGDWTRQLAKFRFEERHAAPVARLICKDDVFLAEAGLELAVSLPSNETVSKEIAAAVEAHLRRPVVDDWILHRIAQLLSSSMSTSEPEWLGVHRELVRIMRAPHDRHARYEGMIMRNMGIHPRYDLLTFFEQRMLNVRKPREVDQIVLPLVEEKHGTKGFEATQRKIFESLGLDADVYLARIVEL